MEKSNSSLTVKSDSKNLASIRNFIREAAESAGLDNDGALEICLAVDEACANIINHGYKNDSGDIVVSAVHDESKLTISLSDNAHPYNPLEQAVSADLDAPLNKRILGGMGVLLVKQSTDMVKYQSPAGGGNTLIMTKYCHNDEGASDISIIKRAFECSEFFSNMPTEMINSLCAASSIEHFEKGSAIFKKGDPGDSTYIVTDGEASVHEGDLIVATLVKYDTFGELAAFEDKPRTASITAKTDLSVVRLGRKDIIEIMSQFPDSGIEVARSLCKRLRDRTKEVIDGSLNSARMEQELEIGRKIQIGFITDPLPEVPGWELGAYFEAAKEVAGDFYDVFNIDGHSRVGLIVADVCDKGVGAALFMTLFRSLLRSTAKMHEYSVADSTVNKQILERPDELLKRCVQFTNNYISSTHGHTSMFATIFFGLLEPETGHLCYINAGHEAPFIISQGKIKTRLENTGPVVGLFEGAKYRVGEVSLEKNETLFAYTDGVTDAVNAKNELFTEERLVSLLIKESADDLTKKIIDEIKDHMGDAPQFDDITILSVSRK
ncbi:MAG: SpoIIE family protein phosphatase [Rhodospirillaceae bacterium]|nr:SpoIIE family protein phosphatase [Rhodospirillaceae bacterium]